MKNHIFTLFVIAFALFFISKANAQTNSIVVKKDTVTAYEGDSLIVDMIKNDYSTDGGTIKITGIFKNPMHTYFIKYNANEIHLYVPYVFKDYSPYLFKVKDTLIVKITDTINNTFSRDTLIINILNNDKKLNYIDINNVKAFFKNGFIIPYLPTLYKLLPKQYSLGDFCTYKVPKDSSTSTILYAELWVGGLDNNNNPRLMGTTYDPDYFRYGPLTTDGKATTTINESDKWNRIWKISRADIENHIQNYSKPGYVMPEAIKTWPAHGDTSKKQDFYLAPFIDVDKDGIYNPAKGDFPELKGDQEIFYIFNDFSFIDSIQATRIGIENHITAYSYYCDKDTALNNTVFLTVKTINRSSNELKDTYIGMFTDFNIGYVLDDYIGCDVKRGTYYGYNGRNIDGVGIDCHYGANPPAQGLTFLKGPSLTKDGKDNPAYNDSMKYNNDLYTLSAINGSGFEDGIVDNESLGLRKFIYFTCPSYANPNSAILDPYTPIDFYNYLRGYWMDTTQLKYGGSGHYSDPRATSADCDFMFPGNSDPRGWGTGGNVMTPWSEESDNNKPGDRRGLGSSGPFTFEPGQVETTDYAFVYGRANSGGNLASVQVMLKNVDSIRYKYVNNKLGCHYKLNGIEKISTTSEGNLIIYPNPAKDYLNIAYERNDNKAAMIQIYDIVGNLITEDSFTGKFKTIDVSNLPKGLYFIKVSGTKGSGVKKFVK